MEPRVKLPALPLLSIPSRKSRTRRRSPCTTPDDDRWSLGWGLLRSERELVAEASVELPDPPERVQLLNVLLAGEGT